MAMNGGIAEEALEVAHRAETKANGAYDHALALHEQLGRLYRLVESVRIQLGSLDAEVRSFSTRISSFRSELESVPEIVDEAITEHGIKEDAKQWRNIKEFFKTGFGKAVQKAIEILVISAIAGSAGYIWHKLGSK